MTKRVEEGREWVEEEREGVKEKREGVEEGEGAPGWSRGLILSLGYLHAICLSFLSAFSLVLGPHL